MERARGKQLMRCLDPDQRGRSTKRKPICVMLTRCLHALHSCATTAEDMTLNELCERLGLFELPRNLRGGHGASAVVFELRNM